MPSEELAFLGALAKFGMGMLHGDGNTRQCMATAVVAYKQAFGFDAPPYTYADFEESDALVFVGSNLCIAHPIMWERVCKNQRKPEIVVIDPRKTETAVAATQHLALRPKSDLRLFYGIANLLIKRGWIDRGFIDRHTSGFEAFAAAVEPYTLAATAEATGLPAAEIERLVTTIHERERVSFWWTMGVNQSHEGVRLAQAIIAIALMTGNIGRPGTGANSITGQCNAMGSRLFSNTTNLLGGHDFAKPEHRAKVAGVLGIDEGRIPREGSWAYDQIMEGILAGKIRGLWIVATNTAHSWINQADAHEVLGRLDLLVVQDMYATTETVAHAHLVLPAAGWGEKEGTFINSERRFGLLKKVARAPGESLADFYIFRLIAEAWGCGDMFARWKTPEEVFAILKELSRGQPCDITGIADYGMIEDRRRHPVAAARGRRRRTRQRAAPVRGRPLLPRRRPRAFHLRGAARRARADRRALSVRAADRAGQLQPVAHADAHGEVGDAAQAVPVTAVRRDQPGRRAHPRPDAERMDRRRIAARRDARPRPPDLRRAARAAVHPDALRRHEPADAGDLRPLLAPARVQALRRPRPPRQRRAGLRHSNLCVSLPPCSFSGVCSLSAAGIFGRPVSTKFGPYQGDEMKSTSMWKRFSAAVLLMTALGGTGALVGGCAYGGVASTPDGTVVITRNDMLLFGLLRKVYVCKVNGDKLACTETPAP